jgi:sugar lactone lactonase YvrE
MLHASPLHSQSRVRAYVALLALALPLVACSPADEPAGRELDAESGSGPLPPMGAPDADRSARTGAVYLSMWNANEVRTFSDSGEPLDTLRGELDGPRGIAIHPDSGEVWVASERGGGIGVFDSDHRWLRRIEAPHLMRPVGLRFRRTMDRSLELYVTNGSDPAGVGGDLVVIDDTGALIRRIVTNGLADPSCLEFLPDGSVLVANRLEHRVDRFDDDGNLLRSYVWEAASGDAALRSTMAIAIAPEELEEGAPTFWVSGGAGARALVRFSLDGEVQAVITRDDLRALAQDPTLDFTPQGMDFTEDGRLVVASWDNQLFRFTAEGTLLDASGRAFAPDGPAEPYFETGPGTARSLLVDRPRASEEEP